VTLVDREQCLPPAVVLTIPIEGRPRVEVRYSTMSELARLEDWLNSHDELLALLGRAQDLIEGWSAP
jgi:hypothetical protein